MKETKQALSLTSTQIPSPEKNIFDKRGALVNYQIIKESNHQIVQCSNNPQRQRERTAKARLKLPSLRSR